MDDADQYFALDPFSTIEKEPRRFSQGALSTNTCPSAINRKDTINSSAEPFIRATTESLTRFSVTPQYGEDGTHEDSVHNEELTEVRLVSGSSRSSGVSIQCGNDSLHVRRHSSLSTQQEESRDGGEQALDTIYESGSYMDSYTQREIV